MVADREIVSERCARIQRYVNDLRAMSDIPLESLYFSDFDHYLAAIQLYLSR